MNEEPIRADEIQSYLALLHGSLGGSRAPVSPIKLREFYDRKNYTEMVKLIRDGMKLDLRVRVALVKQHSYCLPWVLRDPSKTAVYVFPVQPRFVELSPSGGQSPILWAGSAFTPSRISRYRCEKTRSPLSFVK